MKLLSAQQIKQWDAFTMQSQKISESELMERAAMACTRYLLDKISSDKPILIFCGNGNNGGDGLVIARLLIEQQRTVDVYVIQEERKGSECFRENLSLLERMHAKVYFLTNSSALPSIHSDQVVIDCLFGTGLNRVPAGIYADVIQHINAADTTVIAIDMPSGMFADQASDLTHTVKATITLSFQITKLCFLIAENAERFGHVVILPIGLDESFLQTIMTPFETSDVSFIQKIYRPRKEFSHKGHHGHALLMAGSEGKSGAAILSAKACLRSGAGLLTCCSDRKYFSTLNIALPEAMTVDAEDLHDLTKFKAIGIGPGLGQSASAQNMLTVVLENEIPTVADADALNMMAGDLKKLSLLPAGSVITPHPKEFDRIFGSSSNHFERIRKAIQYTEENDIVIVLKDHHSLVAYQGRGVFNMTGNAGLAKGGSGDILTGIILALLAQNYSGFEAALLGTYLHGAAADAALNSQSAETMLATDVIDHLAAGFKQLQVRKR